MQCNDGLAEVRKAKANKGAADKAADELADLNMDPSDRYVIGIDLGTTYSCVSVWKDGEAQVSGMNDVQKALAPRTLCLKKGWENLEGRESVWYVCDISLHIFPFRFRNPFVSYAWAVYNI